MHSILQIPEEWRHTMPFHDFNEFLVSCMSTDVGLDVIIDTIYLLNVDELLFL